MNSLLYIEGSLGAEIMKWVVGLIFVGIIVFVMLWVLANAFGPRILEYKEENGRGWFFKGLWEEVIVGGCKGFVAWCKSLTWRSLIPFNGIEDDAKRHKVQAWSAIVVILLAVFVLAVEFLL